MSGTLIHLVLLIAVYQQSLLQSTEWTHSIIDRIARESRGLVRQSTTFTKRRQRSCY